MTYLLAGVGLLLAVGVGFVAGLVFAYRRAVKGLHQISESPDRMAELRHAFSSPDNLVPIIQQVGRNLGMPDLTHAPPRAVVPHVFSPEWKDPVIVEGPVMQDGTFHWSPRRVLPLDIWGPNLQPMQGPTMQSGAFYWYPEDARPPAGGRYCPCCADTGFPDAP